MRKLILITFLFFSFKGWAQTPTGFTKLNSRIAYTGLKGDSILMMPTGADTPRRNRLGYLQAGQLELDTVRHKLWYFSGGQWRNDSKDTSSYVTRVTASGLLTSTASTTPNISSNVSSKRLVGRYSDSAGIMQQIKLGTNLSLSNDTLKATFTENYLGTVTGVSATGLITSDTTSSPTISTSMATNRLVGRYSAGSGIMQEIKLGTNLSLSNDTLKVTATGGTVTSVGLSLPSEITVTNSPVTTSGTLTGAWASQSAYKVFGRASGSGTPSFISIDTTFIASFSDKVRSLFSAGTGLSYANGVYTNTGDLSATNELQTIAVSGTTTGITTLSNSGGSMTIAGGGINTVGVSGSTITVTGTEVGTVSSVSVGNLSPLFTSSVSNSTSAASVSYTLSNTTQYTVLGRSAIGTGVPSYISIDTTFISNFSTKVRPLVSLTTSGSSGAATYNSTTGVFNIPQYQAAGTYVTQVTADGLLTSSGGTTPNISSTIAQGKLAGRGGSSGSGALETISVGGILSFSGATLLATEVDGSTTNELQTLAISGGTNYGNIVLSNLGGSATIAGGGINTVSVLGTTITVTGTEVDGSTTNELQTISNTSNSTTHTATLSNSGGSLQLVEGTGISLTTTGTTADGVVTISGNTGTVTTLSVGNLSPLFTASVSNPTTTPSISFTQSNAASGTVFANNAGSSNAPVFTSSPTLGVANTTEGSLTFYSGTSGSSVIRLTGSSGNYNFNLPLSAGSAGQVLTSQGGGSSAMTWTTIPTFSITADNGLTMNTSTNVQLGGTLNKNTTIDGGSSYNLSLTGNYSSAVYDGVLKVTNSGTSGRAIYGYSSSTSGGSGVFGQATTGGSGVVAVGTTGNGLYASATSGVGVRSEVTSGTGIVGISTSGEPGVFIADPSSTNTDVTVLRIQRNTTGTAANNIGAAIQFNNEYSDGTAMQASGVIVSRWDNATYNTLASSLAFKVYNTTSGLTDKMTLLSTGQLKLNNYGTGTFTGTPAYDLMVDASGNFIEVTNPITTSGTYTPTLTSVSNVSSSTAYSCQYLRIGSTVTVSGKVTISPTSSGSTKLGISLPISSALTQNYQLAGTGNDGTSGVDLLPAMMISDATNDRAELLFYATTGAGGGDTPEVRTFYFHFTYQIL